MAHAPIVVKRVDEELHHALLELWVSCRAEAGASREAASRQVGQGSVSAALNRPDVCAYLALSDGRPMGYVVLTDQSLSPFLDAGCICIDQLFVARDARRQGVATQLLAAVATHAERAASDQVMCQVPASGRDANRFYARFGFTALSIRRVTATAALRRRLAGEAAPAHTLDHLLARRRSARIRAAHQHGRSGLSPSAG